MKPEVLNSWSLEIDYSRAPCLGADQKARGLWERDWFVICETKWRQQAEDNPHSHGGRRNNSGRKQFFLIPAAAGKRNGRVEKKNSARNKSLQVVVTGQT